MGNLNICIRVEPNSNVPGSDSYWHCLTSATKNNPELLIGPKPCKRAIIGWQEQFWVLIGVPECSASDMQIGG